MLLHRDAGIVGVGTGLVRIGGSGVDDVAARVDFGLGHGVGGGVVPGFAHIELAVGGGCIGHQGQVADEGVVDGDAGQGLVAGVFHGDGVADDLAGGIGGAARNGGVLDDVQAGLEQHVAKIDVRLCGIRGRDQDRCGVGGGTHPAVLLYFTHDVRIVVRVGPICIRNHRECVLPVGIGHGKFFASVPDAVSIFVQENFPVGQAHFVICRTLDVVSAIGIAQAVAIHVTEFHATDLAHDDGRRGQLDRCGTAAIDVHRGLQ